MSKNSLYDLADHLFERIEYVTDQSITGKKLKEEIDRTEATVKAATQIVNIASLLHKAKIAVANAPEKIKMPSMLEDKPR
ncbi:MAG: hypothetical protein LBQ57_12800 [Spirochaetales bacterium]|jgi:benzoyl-CoA reductase/2-hydroxyglutaryl-CoA dehydratase subunit BcrC/BadD/HgdB|nr:hypothetical protein [Spirochaetales bacterium]